MGNDQFRKDYLETDLIGKTFVFTGGTDGWHWEWSWCQEENGQNGSSSRKMAKELEGTGVTINALNPGFVKTNLLLGDFDGGNRTNCGGKGHTFFPPVATIQQE